MAFPCHAAVVMYWCRDHPGGALVLAGCLAGALCDDPVFTLDWVGCLGRNACLTMCNRSWGLRGPPSSPNDPVDSLLAESIGQMVTGLPVAVEMGGKLSTPVSIKG